MYDNSYNSNASCNNYTVFVNHSTGINDVDMMSSLTVAQKILVTNSSKLS